MCWNFAGFQDLEGKSQVTHPRQIQSKTTVSISVCPGPDPSKEGSRIIASTNMMMSFDHFQFYYVLTIYIDNLPATIYIDNPAAIPYCFSSKCYPRLFFTIDYPILFFTIGYPILFFKI